MKIAELEDKRAFKTALQSGDVEAVRRIGAEFPNLPCERIPGLEPWMCMAAAGDSVEMLRALHEMGANPNLTGYGGKEARNALHKAASEGRLENVRYLYEIGTEIDLSKPTRNLFFAAVFARSLPIAQYLLEIGVDSTVRYDGYRGPYMDALAFAWESGERAIARAIAMHQAKGDPARVEEILAEAKRVADLNNART